MAEITALMVKQLRESTGAGMMDAKKALVENNGDMEASVDWLRTKGLAKAAKKAGRAAAEGLVAVATNDDHTYGVAVEINSETDFVSRNEKFQGFVDHVVSLAKGGIDTIEALVSSKMDSKSVSDTLSEMIATIGENMQIRRLESVKVSQGYVASYVHNAIVPGKGKIGVLVGLESARNKAELETLGKQVAMHIAAANPLFLNIEGVDKDALERERNVLKEQAKEQGKPDDIAEKMVEGRIRKYYEEVVLTEQIFLMDGETKISKLLGNDIKLSGFVRMVLGEGVEVEETDFAAEVAAVAKQA